MATKDTSGRVTHEVGASLNHRQIMLSLSGLMVGMFIAAIDQTIVATALPAIVTDLGGLKYLSWVIVGYLLTSTASTPLWGKIGDLYGRRRMFQLAVVIFLIGSLMCGLAPSMLPLIIGRLVQGIGGGGLYALCFGIVGDLVPPRQRGRYIGYFAGMFATAGVIGPLVGGLITDSIGWRWIFTINLPIGIASLAVTAVTLHLPSTRREARLDLVGATVLVAGVICLILASVWGGDTYAWASAQIIGLGAAALVLLALFLVWENQVAEPILPLRLFGNKVVATLFALSFLMGPVFYAASAFIPLFMQGVKGFTATESGLMLAPNAAGMSIAAIITGRLTTRTGKYKHWVVIGTGVLIADVVLLARLDALWSTWHIAVLMVLIGLALGMVLPVLSTASQNAVELSDLGVVTAAVTFFRTLGGTFGIAVFGAVLRARFDGRLSEVARTTTLPEGTTARSLADRPAEIHGLLEPLKGLVQEAMAHAVGAVFLAAIPIAVVVFILALVLEELPLRTSTTLNAGQSDEARAEVAAAAAESLA
ncbi:MAG: MFS transporter [Acidimicrobiia bacterium]|nr:MFS transporter [Acidimicrobiia bacterium]